MHQTTIEKLSHTHTRTIDYADNENRMLKVVLLTTITMVIEILAGH